MVVEQLGNFKIKKDGTSYYRVLQGRKRIASSLLLLDAVKYMNRRYEQQLNVVESIPKCEKCERLLTEVQEVLVIEMEGQYCSEACLTLDMSLSTYLELEESGVAYTTQYFEEDFIKKSE